MYSVLSWASSVHRTACYCVMYCFIKHRRMKTCGDWKNSSTYAHSRQKVEVTARSVGRSVIQAFSQAGTHWLRSWVGHKTCRLSVNINTIVSEIDEMVRAVKRISVTNLEFGTQPLVVVFGTLPVNVSAITKRGSRRVPKKLPEPRYKSQCSGRKQ